MYVFIAGLILLGAGLMPAINQSIINMSAGTLYWVNIVSGLVDGATLASVELAPRMTQLQLRYVLLSLLIASGSLVPGNASNLVAAHKLKITYADWAKVGVPIGGLLMVCYYISMGAFSG